MSEPRTYGVAEFVTDELGRVANSTTFGTAITEVTHLPGTSDITVLFEDGTAFAISIRRVTDNAGGAERDEAIDARAFQARFGFAPNA